MPRAVLGISGNCGVESYDTVAWSAPPILHPYPVGNLPIESVRHLGNISTTSVQAQSFEHLKKWDALLLIDFGPGSTEARISGSQVISVSAYQALIFVPVDADSVIEFAPATSSVAFHLPPRYLESLVDPIRSSRMPVTFARCPPSVAQQMLRLEREIASPGFKSKVLVDTMLASIATALCDLDRRSPPNSESRIALTAAKLSRVREFVEENLTEPIGLQEMAAIAELSVFHFSRAFKSTTGCSPYQYVRARRLAFARQLLVASDRPIVDIALSAGFTDQSHFTAAFSNAVGMAPGRYQREVARARSIFSG